jgi:competence protein ComEC
MTETADIKPLALAFTFGAASGLLLSRISMHAAYISSATSLLVALTLTVITSADRRQAEILLLFLTAGVFCAATSTLTSLGAVAGKPLFAGLAADFRSMISSIPFPHEGTASLVNALLTGDRSSLDDSVMNSFRDSGASHILALSGLHLGIIYGILLKVTSIFGKHPTVKTIRSLIIISLCGIYTLATGASPSLVRAFLFILVNETARLTHRSNNPLRVYCAALFIQTAINPQVISSTGFQLSYLAMAGIFLLYPALKKWYPQKEAAGDMLIENDAGLTESDGLEGVMIDKDAGRTESDVLEGGMIDKGCCRARRCWTSWMKTIVSAAPRKIWDAAALTISCQVFTGPLAWWKFGTFPKYFLLTNLLSLPLTSAVMLLSVSTSVLFAIGICPDFLISLTDSSASLLLFIMKVISSM